MATGDDLVQYLSEYSERKIRTGLLCFDLLTNGGLRNGHVTTIAGVTGYGKTSIAEQIALEISEEYEVDHYPLEIKKNESMVHFGAKLSQISTDVIRKEGIDDATRAELNSRRLIINNYAEARVPKNKLFASIRKHHAPVVVIDHVRHIEGWLKGNAPLYATEYTQDIVNLASELDIHIILCAQIGKEGMSNSRRHLRPTLGDIQDTSALAQLSSTVILVHRPFYERTDDDVLELIVAKNRFGPARTLHTRWLGQTTTAFEIGPQDTHIMRCCMPKTKKSAIAAPAPRQETLAPVPVVPESAGESREAEFWDGYDRQ